MRAAGDARRPGPTSPRRSDRDRNALGRRERTIAIPASGRIKAPDASVAVAALRNGEPGHAEALRRCLPLFAGRDQVVVPSIFDLEVTSALVRREITPDRVAAFLARHLASRRLVSIGPRVIRAARTVVSATRLRAADALYVWLAAREDVPLVTAYREVLERGTRGRQGDRAVAFWGASLPTISRRPQTVAIEPAQTGALEVWHAVPVAGATSSCFDAQRSHFIDVVLNRLARTRIEIRVASQ